MRPNRRPITTPFAQTTTPATPDELPFFIIQDLVPNTDVTAVVQALIDAAPLNTEYWFWQLDSFTLSSPLRLETNIGIKGLGLATIFNKDAFWYGGPSVLIGPIEQPHIHGAAILDDADFSYVFSQAAGTPLDPIQWMDIGMNGCYPIGLTELNLQIPLVFNSNALGTVFTIHGESEATPVTHMILDVSWKFTQDFLVVTFWTSATGIQLESTTDFSASIGTRHMVEFDWDGVTAKLLVDGVVEASAAIGGVFSNDNSHAVLGTYTNYTATIGGRWIQFGQALWDNIAEFDLGGFYLGTASLHQANYAVNWNIPSTADSLFMLICQNDREVDDLIKPVSFVSGYSWMQAKSSPGVGTSTDVSVEGFSFGVLGAANDGTSVQVNSTIRARVKDITSIERLLAVYGSNCFYGEYETLNGSGGQRVGSLFHGGLCTYNGVFKFSGADIGVAFVGAGFDAETIHTYDYNSIGVWIDGCTGFVDTLAASDESTTPGIDPEYGMVLLGVDGQAGSLEINNLDVNVISSDITIPVQIRRNRENSIVINGASGIIPGATTPPAYFFEFRNPTLTDPIQATMILAETGTQIPIADLPQLVIGRDGPCGGVTLTNAASTTINARQGRRWNYTGVTLTQNTVLVLSDELVEAGYYVQDGTVFEIEVDPIFAGFTLTIQNYDATPLAVFNTPGYAKTAWDTSGDTWDVVEAF